MIKNLKYRLAEMIKNSKQVRIGSIALFISLTIIAITLLGCPIHTVEIFDGQRFYNLNKMYSHSKFAVTNVSLNNAGIDSSERITVTYPVHITCKDETVTIDFAGGTVSEALTIAGFTPDENDFVEPSLDTVIEDTVYIDFAAVDYKTGSYTESIAYTTKTVYTDKKAKGYSEITTQGANGKKMVTYSEKFVNGISQGKTITSEEVIARPVNAVKTVGTKVSAVKTSSDVKCISTLKPSKAIKLDKNGNPVNYKSKKVVRATAYTYTGNNCSTGVAPQPGYIAVNPKVIPYGTKLYIKSPNGQIIYGYAVAADTGGFIKNHPTGIDLFMSTKGACTNFGVRNMEIYILE